MLTNAPVISVRNISKSYHKNGGQSGQFGNLIKAPIRAEKHQKATFLALDNISFDVYSGDILGIIGPNGSGKSTLLKILAEITQPTSGEIQLKGKLTSIIDIGTGFHPDLSGRENVFLSASLLGLSKREIVARYEEIVRFSGIRDFINMPVKYYSSGMYLRLAFSVAFHTDIDILLLDEIIAVGDAKFRNRSFEKIKSLSKNGKTILLVSHNIDQIKQFATRCIFLELGKIKAIGSVGEVIKTYLIPTLVERQNNPAIMVQPRGLQVNRVEVLLPKTKKFLTIEDDVVVQLELNKFSDDVAHQITIVVRELTGAKILIDSFAMIEGQENLICEKGIYNVEVVIEGGLLNYGFYSFDLTFTEDFGNGEIAEVADVGFFEIKHNEEDKDKSYKWMIDSPINRRLTWLIEKT